MNAWKYLVAFFSGFFIFLLVGIVGSVAASIISDAIGHSSYVFGKGIFTMFAFQKNGGSFTFSLQKGIFLTALLGGLLNCGIIKLLHLTKKDSQAEDV